MKTSHRGVLRQFACAAVVAVAATGQAQAAVSCHKINAKGVGPVSAATGKLAGATGTLTLEGIQDLATGKFAEDVYGLICADLGP